MRSDEDVEHPDQRAVDDWFLYGPKNVDIENLVRELTLKRGLRLGACYSRRYIRNQTLYHSAVQLRLFATFRRLLFGAVSHRSNVMVRCFDGAISVTLEFCFFRQFEHGSGLEFTFSNR